MILQLFILFQSIIAVHIHCGIKIYRENNIGNIPFESMIPI